MTVIGVDFGTTNSVVTLLRSDGSVATVRHAFGTAEMDVIRSVLCFWNDGEKNRIVLRSAVGPAAIEAYLDDPLESRLMMSLKSYLAQRSFTETRVFGRAFTLEDLIGLFLRAILPPPSTSASPTSTSPGLATPGLANPSLASPGLATPGLATRGLILPGSALPADTVLIAGRPVRFAGDAPDDAFGEQRLRASYAVAGWGQVQTALEPEAAGYRFARGLTTPATVLIGDFGGGTSDFSVLRFAPGSSRPVTALAHAGVGIAGDTFDFRIMDHVVSPRLGKGTTYRPGNTDLPVPPEYYSSFARWHRLSLMRAPKTMRDIEAVTRTAKHPDRLRALLKLIRDELGYELYRTVSGVKAELSRTETAVLHFRHADFAIDETIARQDFEHWIAPDIARIAATVDLALAEAGTPEDAIDRVFLTGGTSLVPAVRGLFTARFGEHRVTGGDEFVSVAEGLALIGRDRAQVG